MDRESATRDGYLVPRFNTWRMVRNTLQKYYTPQWVRIPTPKRMSIAGRGNPGSLRDRRRVRARGLHASAARHCLTVGFCASSRGGFECQNEIPDYWFLNADIKSQTLEELQTKFQIWGDPAYRVTQLLEWLYGQRATRWDSMSNLPRSLRDQLQKHYSLQTLALVQKEGSADTTHKFLWRLPDASLIESVLIPASPALYGDPSDRHTLCVSTQVGCAYGCKFCASGLKAETEFECGKSSGRFWQSRGGM
jgi:hypothetical protein